MGNISSVFFGNEYSLYFFYGLAFLITGLVLLMRGESKFEFGQRVWLLAGFALVHGIAELLHSWIFLEKNYIFSYDISWAFVFERILVATSFMLLFFFGIELVLIVKPRLRLLRLVPALLWLGWMGYFIGWKHFVNEITTVESVHYSIVTSRYLLGFPSAMITSIGLYMFNSKNFGLTHEIHRYVKASSLAFAVYAVMAGLIVRPGQFFPANLINSENLLNLTGIPVEVFRMTCAIAIAYFVMKILQVTDSEILRRLELAEINEAVFEERERISRDIHDGILQSIYSVGLRLGRYMLVHKEQLNDEQVKDLEFAVGKLNDAMFDIRQFIRHLTTLETCPDIQTIIAEITREFTMYPEFRFKARLTGKPVCLDNNKLVNIYYFVKEGLSNVRKHSHANNVTLEIEFSDGKLKVRIADDGIGLGLEPNEGCSSKGMGLKNMYERAQRLNGYLNLCSKPGAGTEVLLDIPV